MVERVLKHRSRTLWIVVAVLGVGGAVWATTARQQGAALCQFELNDPGFPGTQCFDVIPRSDEIQVEVVRDGNLKFIVKAESAAFVAAASEQDPEYAVLIVTFARQKGVAEFLRLRTELAQHGGAFAGLSQEESSARLDQILLGGGSVFAAAVFLPTEAAGNSS